MSEQPDYKLTSSYLQSGEGPIQTDAFEGSSNTTPLKRNDLKLQKSPSGPPNPGSQARGAPLSRSDTQTEWSTASSSNLNSNGSKISSSSSMVRLKEIEKALQEMSLSSTNTDSSTAPQVQCLPSAHSSMNSKRSEVQASHDSGSASSSSSTEDGSPTRIPPTTVLDFSGSSFGTDLSQVTIAHCDETQKMLDDNEIAWGVQYELARGVSAAHWSWEDVRRHIPNLKGCNAEAAFKVQATLKGDTSPFSHDLHLWQQLDREQQVIFDKSDHGLGLKGAYDGIPNWYGGRIQQLGHLEKVGQGYKIQLGQMESQRSYRFARYYGSRRFLQIHIPKKLLREALENVKHFFTAKFLLCGRIFVPFSSKGAKVYLVETDENCGRTNQRWCADETRISFRDFINWHNPIEENWDQVINKYATRFALGLSNSIPAVEFQTEDIHFIEDITADGWSKGSKSAPADKLMTDGCGYINLTALHTIMSVAGYNAVPAGVQGRIDGSKGFWILHPSDDSNVPKIWIRHSQRKIQSNLRDRAHRIFDLVSASHPSPTCALSRQSIVNLYANGIPKETLCRMMESGLVDEISPLLQWNNVLVLEDAIRKCGGISGARSQRVASSLNRVLGFVSRDWDDDDDDLEDDEDTDNSVSSYTGRGAYSGTPFGLHEFAIELLQAGFHPSHEVVLQSKIEYIVQTAIEAVTKKCRIPIAESLEAFIVPDPLGLLREGEVCLRFSQPRNDPQTHLLSFGLKGEILVGRYPIRLPSDVQLVNAVDRPEYSRWPDVLIVSTKGERSIASILADGDMDGDKPLVFYNQELVRAFRNKPFTRPPQNFMTDNFVKDVQSMESFFSSHQSHEAFQNVLMSNLTEPWVGLYSGMHERSILKSGYHSRESIRLAYIFSTMVDSSKNGLRLKPKVALEDRERWYPSNAVVEQPNRFLDILGALREAGALKGRELMERCKAALTLNWNHRDKVVREPYDFWNTLAMEPSLRPKAAGKKGHQGVETDEQDVQKDSIDDRYRELQIIREHVNSAWTLWDEHRWDSNLRKERKKKDSKVKYSQDGMALCARKFAETPKGIKFIRATEVEKIKASYAYIVDLNFAFTVAFQTICTIKAEASGTIAPVLRIFDESRVPSSKYLTAFKIAEESRRDPTKSSPGSAATSPQ